MESIYRLILKKALIISWKNKWLWFLGFFAAVIGNGGVYEALIRGFNNISEGRSVFFTLREYMETGVFGMISWAKLSALWQSDPAAFGLSIFSIILMLCALAVLITLGVICQGGTISGVIAINEKKKISLKDSFKIGVDKFWSILELNIITKVILLGILVFLAYLASLIVFASSAANMFIYVLSFIIFIILGIIIYFLTIYGTAFVILRGRNAFSGLKDAWHIFTKNVLLNLEVGLLLFVVNLLVVFAFFLLNFIVLSPLVLIYFICLVSSAKVCASIVVVIMLIVFLILMILVGAWWSAFQLGVWAMLFEQLAFGGVKSKTQRLFEHVLRKIRNKN